MKAKWMLLLAALSLVHPAQAQVLLDCSCLATQSVMMTNACQAVIPDLCQFTNCYQSTIFPPPVITCSQTPAAGTPVGPGGWPITLTLSNSFGTVDSCALIFFVNPPITNVFALICATNKTVECGTTWNFNPPTPTNACCPTAGIPNGGVTLSVLGTVTNGNCPQLITRTWQAVDNCGQTATCSQKVTVVDTTPPLLDCNCLRNPAVIQLTVIACSNAIPDLCLLTSACASDNCGPLTCSQSPAAGTIVLPGVYPITVTVTDCASNSAACVVNFTVIAPAGGCISIPPCPNTTNIWHSGMGGASGNVLLAPGTPDPNYTLVTGPGGCTGPAQVLLPGSLPGVWLPNGPNSQWIGGGPLADCDSGVYHYRLCFYLPCTQGASVLGQWTADDFASMYLNGQPTGFTVPSVQFPNVGFNGWHPVAITNGFLCGTNCLDFYVTNAYTFINPTGFRAELTNVFNDCCCQGQTTLSVFSGRDANGLMPQNAPDPQFTFTCTPPGINPTVIVANPHPLWLPNGPNSQWVGPVGNLNAPAGLYCYTLNFNLPPCTNGNPNYSITGQWAADDTGTIYLNGSPTAFTLPASFAFTNWHAFNLTSGLVPGPNTLTFYVTNFGNSATGLRVELTAASSCCACTNCFLFINCPANLTNYTCGTSAVVNYPAPATSNSCNGPVSVVCTPPSGSAFPLGTTNVICTASDLQGHSASCSFAVTVIRTPPYTVLCPPLNLSVTGCPPRLPNLFALATITTNCPNPGALTYTNYGPNGVLTNGAPLPPGQTVVILRICDGAGNCRDCDVIITAVLSPGCCLTTPVLSLFSGVNAGGPLAGGALDPQFTTGAPLFTTPNPYVASSIHPLWLPNTAVSKWVGPAANASGFYGSPGGVYVYTNRFFLCATNQAALSGRWTADDAGAIWLNGVPTANTLPAGWAFTNWHPVSITSGFLPGWNTLTFRVTNASFSVTGLRTEITGTACCNTCVAIACPANISLTNCGPSVAVTYPAPSASSSCAALASVSCTPASGSFFPPGTNVVTCTAVDALGNAATCSFAVRVRLAAPPVVLNCPPNQTILTCSNSAVAYFKTTASGQTGPVVCTPPSGTTFPVGTNVVTCTASNACGSASCSFLIIVKKHQLGPPALTITAGLPDNFALPVEASPTNACMVAAFSGYPFWKGFDAVASDTLFGHRFTGLPNNIVKAELVVRMRPTADSGAANDGIFVGLPTCVFTNFRWSASIAALPGAGGNWNPGHPATTFTLDLGALNPLILSDLNTQGYLDVVVHDDTTVDYMQLCLWRCPPPTPGIGVPYDRVGGATTALRPIAGTGISLPAICVFPNPNFPSGILLQPGGAQAISFTTVLDFDAPVGAGLDLVLPPDPRTTNGMPYLSFRNKGPKGYCVKTAKLYDDEPDISYRSFAVGTNGDLFPSFTWDAANIQTNVLLFLNRQPGVTSVVMTVTLDLETREVSLEFPHCLWTPDNARKGWDGCIYGNGTPSKGTNKTARLILMPAPPHTPPPPVLELSLLATGLSEVLVEDPGITALGGRKWGDGHVTLMKAYDDGETLSFIAQGEGGGVHTDLGNAASFELGIHHFENGDIPDEEQLFRIIGGPIRGLTNRPPPPTIPLRLAKSPDGVDCTVDFSDLGATAVTVQLWNNGVLVGQGTGEGPAIPLDNPLIIDRWPDRFGQLNVQGVLRLTAAEPFSISGLIGDEIRIIPTLPPDAALPDFLSALECLVSDGMDTVLYGLQRTLACAPVPLQIAPGAEAITIDWSADGFRLQGAEQVTGPWFDLGVTSPVTLNPNHPARFFRLVCD